MRLIYRESSTVESKPATCIRQGVGWVAGIKIWKIGNPAFPLRERERRDEGGRSEKGSSVRRDKRRNLDELVNWRTLPNKRIRHISLRMNCRGHLFPLFPRLSFRVDGSSAKDNAWLAGVALSPRVTIKEDRDESRGLSHECDFIRKFDALRINCENCENCRERRRNSIFTNI